MKIAEAKPPSKKYFSAASEDVERCRSKATSTYSPIERISRPRKMTMRSLAWVITIAPGARGEREDVELDARDPFAHRPVVGHERGHDHAERDHARGDDREVIEHDRVGDRDRGAGACATQRHWKKLTTMLALAAAITVEVATTSGTLPRASAEARTSASAAPKKIRTGRIAR